jgi:hypothetical protein
MSHTSSLEHELDDLEPIEQDTEDEAGYGAPKKPARRVSEKAHRQREYSSNFCAALRAILIADGFDEKDLSVAMTVIDAARRADVKLSDGSLPSERRRFQCSAWLMELHRRRESLPFNLTEEEFKKAASSLSRSWRRYWSEFHLKQCRAHTGYIERESAPFEKSAQKLEAGFFVDNLTDFVHQVMEKARSLEGKIKTPVLRFERARSELIEGFRTAHVYAPDWTESETTMKPKDEKESDASDDPERWKRPIKAAVKDLVIQAREKARTNGLTEDEETDFRLELQQLIETVWTSQPPPEKKKSGSAPNSMSSVTRIADTSKSAVSASSTASVSADSFALANSPVSEGKRAISAFKSVGAENFLTLLMDDTKPAGSAPELTLRLTGEALVKRLPDLLERNRLRDESLMIRPDVTYKGVNRIIHLDDCTVDQLPALAPYCFLQILTSDGNGQGFIALDSALPEEAFNDLRNRLLDKLNPGRDKKQVNKGSSGSARWPGSFNKKPSRRAPDGSFPRVSIVHLAEGHTVSPLELERAGLLAPPTPKPAKSATTYSTANLPNNWPDLNTYLQRHWKQDQGKPDRSSGEEAWVCAAARLGWPRHSIIDKLSTISLKAKGRNDDYVVKTVDNGLRWLALQTPSSGRAYSGGRVRVTI